MGENKPANSGNNSATPAIHFGRQVKKARRERGWTIRDLHEQTGLSPGYISDVENGNKGPTVRTALKMDTAFPERRGWFAEYQRDSQIWAPPGYRHWEEYENAATHLRVWCPGTLHGLVQTPEYARGLLETVPGVPPEIIDARAQARAARQKRIILRPDSPPLVWVGVDAVALFREVGSPEVMTAALDHLLSIADVPHITVQVVPALAHPGPISELIVTDNHAAYCEHLAGGYTFTDEETVSSLDKLITKIQAESYRASESVRMIERVRDIWATGESLLTAALLGAPASKSPAPRARSA